MRRSITTRSSPPPEFSRIAGPLAVQQRLQPSLHVNFPAGLAFQVDFLEWSFAPAKETKCSSLPVQHLQS